MQYWHAFDEMWNSMHVCKWHRISLVVLTLTGCGYRPSVQQELIGGEEEERDMIRESLAQ